MGPNWLQSLVRCARGQSPDHAGNRGRDVPSGRASQLAGGSGASRSIPAIRAPHATRHRQRRQSAPCARGVHNVTETQSVRFLFGSVRARGPHFHVGAYHGAARRLRVRGSTCVPTPRYQAHSVGSAHEKGSRGTGWASGLPGRMRGPVTRPRPSVTLSGHSCHDARPLVTGVSGSCHSPT